MIIETITYTDLNGNTKTEQFHFNLSRADALGFVFEHSVGLQSALEIMKQEKDTNRIYKLFRKIVTESYGFKDEDGGWNKSDEMTRKFVNSEAFSELIVSMLQDPDRAARFFAGLTPNLPKEPEDHKAKRADA